MFHRLLNAYKEEGFDFHIGNNKCLCAALANSGQLAHTGGGISISDIAFFFGLKQVVENTIANILVIGNAAGYSSFCIAEIFPTAQIDVIDAEIEGGFNQKGSELTRKISEKHYGGRVHLNIGFSPNDLGKFFGGRKYDLIFIDGKHTNEQRLLDFNGVIPFAADNCVIYLHDVELENMQESYDEIKKNQHMFSFYAVDFTSFGCKALVRNNKKVEEWLFMISKSPIIEHQNPPATIRAVP
jgi:predicted O-methyltransferase YrrM